MHNQITNNLYEFWKHIGRLTNRLIETQNYSAVSMDSSDWPNRIFEIQCDHKIIEKVHKLSKENQLPRIITIAKPNDLNKNNDFVFVSGQKNMALDIKLISNDLSKNPNIKRVKTEKDSIDFAKTASESFGKRYDHNVILKIVNNPKTVRLFIYQEGKECLGCGIIFFDSHNNAGLHLIGTLPKVRGWWNW